MITTRKMSRKDPAGMLERDVMLLVFSQLSARELVVASLTSKTWRDLAEEDDLWRGLCESMWRGKVYNPAAACKLPCWKLKYVTSLQDATRTAISSEELCTFQWTFRFKDTAGQFWMALDPYWTKEGPLMRRVFHEGGALSAAPKDPVAGLYETRWRFSKLKDGVKGTYVKINHWPSLSISRAGDWGWRMESCWVVFEAELQVGGPYQHGVTAEAAPHQA